MPEIEFIYAQKHSKALSIIIAVDRHLACESSFVMKNSPQNTERMTFILDIGTKYSAIVYYNM